MKNLRRFNVLIDIIIYIYKWIRILFLNPQETLMYIYYKVTTKHRFNFIKAFRLSF